MGHAGSLYFCLLLVFFALTRLADGFKQKYVLWHQTKVSKPQFQKLFLLQKQFSMESGQSQNVQIQSHISFKIINSNCQVH